ncbi:rho GTPase-activating protein 31 isoform X2 [Chanos chanos]|uniref:Rho GTPase-activating protein 31 isoform X2 n=1 Tax=Chanos chanos TaxID=29144 RepID=A0A6J2WX21_CHACN|nr:rho GTPase-activating protein 31 isoform X2 [Chanos chanos]
MKNKAAKQKSKRKAIENAFGCDLTEHLQNSGQDVPQVLKTCAEFIEEHGIVDGIYRLSGITSNIQKLRQEFGSDSCPDLTKEVYLQDIHCVGSLCKLYFRELPNPLLTYELYKKFTDAVSVKDQHEQLHNIQSVIKELPICHRRTLEYLSKHLSRLATFSHQTNMHARNLALVWAPNLLRSKEIEVSSCNGDSAFQEVRVQQTVVEFILSHTEQLFDHGTDPPRPREGTGLVCGEKYATLPATAQCGPMKLMSLEEAQARSLSPNHPARKERQRENSLPDTNTATLYHTVIDLHDSKRKIPGKSKWKAIFSLGRSVTDSKGKLSRNGSVFMRAQNISDKPVIRPSKSMDSLCSLPTDEDKADKFAPAGGANGFFVPTVKSRTLGSDINYDLSDLDPNWEADLRKVSGASGGGPSVKKSSAPNASPSSSSPSSPLQKSLPEQLKVFKGDDLSSCQPTSPKNRRMLYSGSAHNGSSRPSFPGSLFPLESSPRHQRKALNISEPFAVSVPLRVSAVISSNSTPCRAPVKDRPTGALPKSGREAGSPELQLSVSVGSAGVREFVPSTTSSSGSTGSAGFRDRAHGLHGSNSSLGYREFPLGNSSGGSGNSIYSNSSSTPSEKEESQNVERSTGEMASNRTPTNTDQEKTNMSPRMNVSHPQQPTYAKTTGNNKETPQSPGKKLDSELLQHQEPATLNELDTVVELINNELWSDVHQELHITESDANAPEDSLRISGSLTKAAGNDWEVKSGAHAKRRSSLPAHPLSSTAHLRALTKYHMTDHSDASVYTPVLKPSPERLLSCDAPCDFSSVRKDHPTQVSASLESLDVMANRLQLPLLFNLRETDILHDAEPWPIRSTEPCTGSAQNDQVAQTDHSEYPSGDVRGRISSPAPDRDEKEPFALQDSPQKEGKVAHDGTKGDMTLQMQGSIEDLSKCLDKKQLTLDLPQQDDEDCWVGTSGGLDQVEPWEDFSTTKQWVTSPLHSPKLEDLFPLVRETSSCLDGAKVKQPSKDDKAVTREKGLTFVSQSSQGKKVATIESGLASTISSSQNKKMATCEPALATTSPPSHGGKVETGDPGLANINFSSSGKKSKAEESSVVKISELYLSANVQGNNRKTETKCENLEFESFNNSNIQDEATRFPKRNTGTPKQRNTSCSQRFHRQVSHDSCLEERNEENIVPKHRPYSLNLDLGPRCIRDISNQQNMESAESPSNQRGAATPSVSKHGGMSLELEMFLNDRQAPMRRNSAPVSVSSIRTPFMIKTCQAKAVPVIPPKIQYSHIPHPLFEKGSDLGNKTEPEKESAKIKAEKTEMVAPLQLVKDPREERENREPAPRHLRHAPTDKAADPSKPTPIQDLPVLRRKRSANGDTYGDCPRPDRSTLLQRSSFRNRPRPQSLILFSPPFPIMDYPPLGDDGKLMLSPIKSPTETSALDVFSKELAENLKTPEGVTLRNKMTLPKSGQRLETSTSCFYQPQRRSMIFDSRSNRQIE